jgi:hypothetical protein
MTDLKELKASLERHNSTFETLLNLIPAKYYLPKDPDEQVRFVTAWTNQRSL